jgi:type I restriction enzyme S subunit
MTKGHLKSRDVLLYKDGGRPGEFDPHVIMFGDGFPFELSAINEHVYRLRASRSLGQNYLFFWLSSDLLMEEMRIRGTGVAIPGLNSTHVRSLPMLFPPGSVASVFERLAEPYVARLLANCKESRTLSVLRDALVPRLVTGDLRAPDAERLAARYT